MAECPIILSDSHIMVGNSSNEGADVAMSGDVTIDNTGATTIKTNVALAGSPTTTTQSPSDNSTKVATTAYADAAAAAAGGGYFTPLYNFITPEHTTHTDGTEDDLFTGSVPAANFANNGDTIRFTFGGYGIQSTTALRQVLILFGSSQYGDSQTSTWDDSGTNFSNAEWTFVMEVMRVSSSNYVGWWKFICDSSPTWAAPQPVVFGGDSEAGFTNGMPTSFALRGVASGTGAASGDIVATFGRVDYIKASANVV